MDALAFHLLLQLLRRGALDSEDIEEIAARLQSEGEADAAHAVRTAPFEAFPPDEAEWRRSKLKLVRDGGNGET